MMKPNQNSIGCNDLIMMFKDIKINPDHIIVLLKSSISLDRFLAALTARPSFVFKHFRSQTIFPVFPIPHEGRCCARLSAFFHYSRFCVPHARASWLICALLLFRLENDAFDEDGNTLPDMGFDTDQIAIRSPDEAYTLYYPPDKRYSFVSTILMLSCSLSSVILFHEEYSLKCRCLVFFCLYHCLRFFFSFLSLLDWYVCFGVLSSQIRKACWGGIR